MYSIDGVTWSTRSEELQAIIDRHSVEQAGFGADLKGEEKEKVAAPKAKPRKFNRVHNDDELDEIIDEDGKEDDIPPDLDVDIDAGDDDIDDIAPKKGGKGSATISGGTKLAAKKALLPVMTLKNKVKEKIKSVPTVKTVAAKKGQVKSTASKAAVANKHTPKKPAAKIKAPVAKSKAKPAAKKK